MHRHGGLKALYVLENGLLCTGIRGFEGLAQNGRVCLCYSLFVCLSGKNVRERVLGADT